jgi:Uma2 family endonuclease
MKTRIVPDVEYPGSDGKPMAETPLHMQVMWDLIQTLIAWFVPNPRVYVWGNMFLYYVPGDPRRNVSPDVMVVKGVHKEKSREVFKVWEEGQVPRVVIEVTSRKTRADDEEIKYHLYRDVLKVREYFLFDPKAQYLKPPLKGYRLLRGVYEPIDAVDGRLPSAELGLHLERHGKELRLWDPATQRWLPTPAESRRQAEENCRVAENQRDREAQARRAAEAEVERLRRQLQAARRKSKD